MFNSASCAPGLAVQLRSLLQASFPDYPDRSYFKLPPHFRYVAFVDGAVVAQVGVEMRVMRVGDSVARTFGVATGVRTMTPAGALWAADCW
jgi:hypothetical protein